MKITSQESLFYKRKNAIMNFNHRVKPQNHTLLKKGKRYLIVKNSRVKSFILGGWTIIGYGTFKESGINSLNIPFVLRR